MGKQNRARRAAKARSKRKAQGDTERRRSQRVRAAGRTGGPEPAPDDAGFSEPELARTALVMASETPASSDARAIYIDALLSMSANVVAREAEVLVLSCIDAAWRGGWQPSELARHVRLRGANATTARLARLAIAADHASRPAATLDPRWSAQIDALDLPGSTKPRGWFRRWVSGEGSDRAEAVAAALDLLAVLFALPHLEHVSPPPGAPDSAARTVSEPGSPSGGELDPLLEKIRNLLAKAESTTFEAEATALTAKAQELMTRYAVDAATLGASEPGDATPVSIRVPIDAPYVDAKSLLLQTVAAAGRCRSIFNSGLDMSTVVGFPEDVAAVEMLFTSLLVQAQTALADAARTAPPGTRTRKQSYRSAFLLAYTHRIGDRLEEINRHVMDEATAEHGTAFLPVLRSRSDRVDDHVRDRFGDLTSAPVRGGHDRAGWAGGRLAADQAAINLADLEKSDFTNEGPTPADHTTPAAELA